jgi:uncharacterized protein YjiS (DUF1127 family)
MFNSKNPWPTSHELHSRVAPLRSRAINNSLRSAFRKLAGAGTRLTRKLAAEWQVRCDIRTLQQLGDRELADIGLGRGEIEQAVRGAGHRTRPELVTRHSLPVQPQAA